MVRVVRRCMPHWFRIGVCRRSALLARETSDAARVLYSRHGVRVGCGEPVRTGGCSSEVVCAVTLPDASCEAAALRGGERGESRR